MEAALWRLPIYRQQEQGRGLHILRRRCCQVGRVHRCGPPALRELRSPVTPCVNSICEGSLTSSSSSANSCQHTILTGWLMQVTNPLSPVGQSASMRDGTGRRDLNWLTSRRPVPRLHACEVYDLGACIERQGLRSGPRAHDKYWLAEACQGGVTARFKIRTWREKTSTARYSTQEVYLHHCSFVEPPLRTDLSSSWGHHTDLAAFPAFAYTRWKDEAQEMTATRARFIPSSVALSMHSYHIYLQRAPRRISRSQTNPCVPTRSYPDSCIVGLA